MEETFTLTAADVRHVTLQDAVQGSAVPEEDKHQVGFVAGLTAQHLLVVSDR